MIASWLSESKQNQLHLETTLGFEVRMKVRIRKITDWKMDEIAPGSDGTSDCCLLMSNMCILRVM